MHRSICYSQMERAAAERQYARLHEDAPWHDGTFTSWRKEPSASHPYHFQDGVTVFISTVDLAPGDNFLIDTKASPARPVNVESPTVESGE